MGEPGQPRLIHPSAQIDPAARIGKDVTIGAFCVIGAGVEIGNRTVIGPHVVIDGPTRIGRENRIHAFAALGGDPQDKKFRDETAELIIGDRNLIREFVTFNRGTDDGGGVTRIGDDNWIMAYVHIAHDCIVGNNVVFANAASLAGHVTVEDHVILGGFTLVHQFCQIGTHAFTSMGSVINRDVPPFVTVAGSYAEPRGINSEGLRRRGYSAERIQSIKRAYRTIYKSGLALADARSLLAEAATSAPDVKLMLDFIEGSQRSLVR
ncbi:MAG: acyl-ACP--UDP-N-acetylglucosamine O-acyltransferase [Xanthomonadales bacterium]|nr:acyl-ACP--UDP-N-acetylglucosamine O-acyltransferase [Xanthomonadales bacterium]